MERVAHAASEMVEGSMVTVNALRFDTRIIAVRHMLAWNSHSFYSLIRVYMVHVYMMSGEPARVAT